MLIVFIFIFIISYFLIVIRELFFTFQYAVLSEFDKHFRSEICPVVEAGRVDLT